MKHFIYLDRYKMYSLSSQLMEGVTDYILKESKRSEEDSTEQKGEFASGRVMAEIIETTSSNIEKKFLHDYAYSVFEGKLVAEGKMFDLSVGDTASEIKERIGNCKIIRVKARGMFVDSNEIVRSLRSFATIMQSFGIITTNDERQSLITSILEMQNAPGSKKPDLARMQSSLKALSNPSLHGDQTGNDKLYHTHLADILEYCFKGSLDLSLVLGELHVSGELSREGLRESIESIIKKYSRMSEVEFTMIGIVTQCGDEKADVGELDLTTMRSGVRNSIAALSEFEGNFSGRLEQEIIVDPIAVYIDL
ncbi:hypothetical protein [Pseudomonas chlororaphis]|uniref:DUF6414 family protein n=1 Tax=Pseudomonas chlororaphis TaxID=587753 RepID=UPI0039E5431C